MTQTSSLRIDVANASTSALVAFYNAHAAKPVSKFADRKTAERRVAALSADLVAQYNARAGAAHAAGTSKAAAKTDRANAKAMAAEKAALFARRLHDGHCPFCGATEDITAGHGDDAGNITHEHLYFCHSCGTEYDSTTGRKVTPAKASETRSTAIAASWNDPTVAAARAERSHVLVKGVEYRSVLQAFQQLGLPVQKHIAFRGQLKAAGKLAFNGIVFQIVTPE